MWPETAIAEPLAVTQRNVRGLLGRLETPVLFGAVAIDERGSAGKRIYNSAFLADANGDIRGRVDKTELIPFAEHLPLGEDFPLLYAWLKGSGRFTAGDGRAAIQLSNATIAVLICYEDTLTAHARRIARRDHAQLLVNLTNDAWFEEALVRSTGAAAPIASRAALTHFALAKLRAIELGRLLVRATNSGMSAVIDARGRATAFVAPRTRATTAATVRLLDHTTPYGRFGAGIPYLLAFGWCALALRNRSRAS